MVVIISVGKITNTAALPFSAQATDQRLVCTLILRPLAKGSILVIIVLLVKSQ